MRYKKAKLLPTRPNVIPRLRLSAARIAYEADIRRGLFSYESSLEDTYLIRDEAGVLVVTGRKGYLLLDTGDIDILVDELKNVKEDLML